MKKLMLSFAAVAAFVSVASAEDAWFNGGLGDGSLSGGEWTVPEEGVTKPSSSYVLENVADDPLSFTATTSKTADSSQNLNFATSAKFAYSYDELPAVDSSAKAGVVVYQNTYYVLAKDDTTNKWVSTGITATLENAVDVSVTITNGTDGAHALYQFGNSTAIDKPVVASGNWGAVDYKGSGEVASLVGTTISLGWPLPGGGSIAVDPAWAAANGISQEAFASNTKLGNGFTASESYVLGLNTNEPFVATFKLSGDKDDLVVSAPTPKAADKVQFDVYVNGVRVAENATLPYTVCGRSAVGSDEKTIEIRPRVDGQSSATEGKSQLIGIWQTPQFNENTSGYIVIPYECDVSNALYNLANEGHDDFMYVYDPESGEWDTWKVNARSTTWEFVEPSSGRTEPLVKVLHPGQAVKVSIGDCVDAFGTAKSFWACGTKVDRTKTTVVSGKYNLIGNPEKQSVPLSIFDANAKIRTFDVTAAHVLPDISYVKYGSVWYKLPLNGSGTTATEITGANAFFLNTTAEEITWTPANNE